MSTAHTPGTWSTDEKDHDEPYQDIRVVSGMRTVCTVWIDDAPVRDYNAEQQANARRIVACVNACAGSSTEWLEFQSSADWVGQFGPPEPFETRYTKELQKGVQYMEQRDQLLESLKIILEQFVPAQGNLKVEQAAIDKAHAAIKKATGAA